jgi:2-polyprenyl-3-methyl-5-hydroxy-6-metoxy-1,4-benzoquinol methylase
MKKNLDVVQENQEEQYEFPYHYIPTVDNGNFSQTRYWSWGYRYLGGIQLVEEQLSEIEFDSLIDIGCGDGRFLKEIESKYPEVDTLGVDYSQRAINFANSMNPQISYDCRDITQDRIPKDYDVATLIEVLEHIPPDDLANFVDATVDTLTSDGTLIVTVPHKNKPVQPKHYQHFDQSTLIHTLEDHFESMKFIPFDEQSRILNVLQKVLGGRGNQFIITNEFLNSSFWRLYKKKYLYTSEKNCGRIAVVCER